MNTNPLGPFLGLNNRLADFALHIRTPQIEGDYLSVLDNVDVDNAKRIRRRHGYSLVQAMSGAHSIYKNYFVRSGAMYSYTLSPSYSESLFKILSTDDKVSYVEHNGSIYYSNGTDSGRIESGIWFPWALPTPNSVAVSSAAGSLLAGWYQVSISYYNSVTGEEGGNSASTNHELTSTGSLAVTLPTTSVSGATHVNVYVSQRNGDVPGLYTTVAVGTASVSITTTTTTRTQNLSYVEPMPACTRLFFHMGRLCGVKDHMVYYCEPYRLGYYRPQGGWLRFETDVSIAIPNQMGLFIAADKTYWIPGDLDTPDKPISDVLPYGAVPGTEFSYPDKSLVGWMGAKGFVTGTTDGEVSCDMGDHITPTLPASGTAIVQETYGYRRVYSCGYSMNLENNIVSTYSSYDFNSSYNGVAAKSDGLYQLGGEDDAGTPILSTICFGKQRFGTDYIKRMPTVYIGVESDAYMNVRVVTPSDDYTYVAIDSTDSLAVQKVVVGKGLRANWFELWMYNQDGSDFAVASVNFDNAVSTRRV